jgi:hypothetical protein
MLNFTDDPKLLRRVRERRSRLIRHSTKQPTVRLCIIAVAVLLLLALVAWRLMSPA